MITEDRSRQQTGRLRFMIYDFRIPISVSNISIQNLDKNNLSQMTGFIRSHKPDFPHSIHGSGYFSDGRFYFASAAAFIAVRAAEIVLSKSSSLCA